MKLLLYLFSFNAGAGFNFTPLTIYNNFTYIDVLILVIFLFIIIKNKITVTKDGIIFSLCLFLLVIWQLFSLIYVNRVNLNNLGPNFRLLYYSFIILIFSGTIKDKSILIKTLNSFLLGIGANLLYSFYLWSLEPRYWSGMILLNNSYLNRNSLYYYILFGLVISLSLIKINNELKNKYIFLSFLLIITLFLTSSRGAWILLSLILMWFSISYLRYKVILIILTSTIMLNLFSFDIQNIIAGIYLRTSGAINTINVRIDYIKIGIEMGLDNFWFGVGLRNFIHEVSNYSYYIGLRDPHNVYAMLFAENGIIGFLIYIIFLFFIIFNLFNLINNKDDLMIYWNLGFIILVIILSLNMVTGVVFSSKLFPFFILYIIGLKNIIKVDQLNRIKREVLVNE